MSSVRAAAASRRSSLFVLLGLAIAVTAPLAAAAEESLGRTHGRTDEERRTIERLETLGYAASTRSGPAVHGVTIHDEPRACPGLNLVTSSHAPVAVLMDSRGVVVHRWQLPYAEVSGHEELPHQRPVSWRRVRMLANGDLVALYNGRAVVKVDARSNLLWANVNGAHHDLDIHPNGDVYVLTLRPQVVDWVHSEVPVMEDYITILSSKDGSERRRISVLESLRGTELDGAWHEAWSERRIKGDILHINAVEILDGRIADRLQAFAEGNVLTSFRSLHAIAVVDLRSEKTVWTHRGDFRRQHDPTVLENGNLLLFDNGDSTRGSRVLEIEPASGEVAWSYGGTEASSFWTSTGGVCQRLVNGNTLITESNNGRAFEVTRDGTIVWEFVNPHRVGKEGEFVANLCEVRRLREDVPLGWLR